MGWTLYFVAVVAALVMGPRGPVYWDSFGYVTQALSGHVGGLALGRPLFVLASHAIVRMHLAVGGSPWTVEPLLRVSWLAVSASAAPLTRALALRCAVTPRAAAISGLMVAASPAMAHTSGTVLTDAPAAALTLLALWFAAAARDLDTSRWRSAAMATASGIVLAIAFGVREQSAYAIVSLLLISYAAEDRPRWIASFAVAASTLGALALVGLVNARNPHWLHGVTGWFAAMGRERNEHRRTLRDVLAYTGWLVALGPIALCAATIGWLRKRETIARPRTVAFAFCVPALAQLVALALYQDIAYSPRYLLAAFPGAIALPGAIVVDQWIGGVPARIQWLLAGIIVPILVAAPMLHHLEAPFLQASAQVPTALSDLPDRSVVITGQPCGEVGLVAEQTRVARGHRPAWRTICAGWTWPPNLADRLDREALDGWTLVLDLRDAAWIGGGQKARHDELERWWQSHNAGRHGGIVVWR